MTRFGPPEYDVFSPTLSEWHLVLHTILQDGGTHRTICEVADTKLVIISKFLPIIVEFSLENTAKHPVLQIMTYDD